MKIHFYIRFHTVFGQRLYITGNHIKLGNDQEGQAMVMEFYNESFWHATLEVDETEQHTLHYQYIFITETGDVIKEAEKDRTLSIDKKEFKDLVVIDTWNDAGDYRNAFSTTPFTEVLLPKRKLKNKKLPFYFTHLFKVKAPLLETNECVCLVGQGEDLNHWSTEKPILLEKSGDWWTAKLDLTNTTFPTPYKYGIYNLKEETFTRFENGDNRLLYSDRSTENKTILHDGFVNLPVLWKGAGVAIPVFSLRSNSSFGIGEFTDIKLLVDWAVQTDLRLIQLLPINDTSATFTWQDSYPYAAISAFALHPVYINLQKAAGKKYAPVIKPLQKKQKQLNSLAEVDYESVLHFKMSALRELYDLQGTEFLNEKEYTDFFENNRHWLVPYAAFCYLRDKWGTSDFNQWRTHSVYNETEIARLTARKSKQFPKIAFYYFVQYHLHLQLTEAVNYAHKKGIALKGDIPIGIYRYGADAWTAPHLYHMDRQAGAPPDDFAVKGQNWGFPTYNWQRMQENHFDWWRKRFHQMSLYFDAFRIDHILGFFRIWSIPIHAVEGILGVFVPAIPVEKSEFGERGIWFDYERFCRPYITDEILNTLFGGRASFIKQTFLHANDRDGYDLNDAYDTQQKVQSYFEVVNEEDSEKLKSGLFDLISNVLLFEHLGSGQQQFHFRISMENTASFQHLDDSLKQKVYDLYIDYFYRRQDEFWKHEALKKLPYLKEATNMLICGEDLGMVPHSVPEVMKRLGILSLEIQRMPKNLQLEYFHPATAPYLSVVTPSTHDMSTIRGWWEEDREKTQRFYNTVLESHGPAPYFCEPWVVRAIVLQHLYAPAMWSIFQLQDLLGMSEKLRRQNPHQERINVPAIPKHYWRYRMHLPLEDLLKEKEFNEELKDYVVNSGR